MGTNTSKIGHTSKFPKKPPHLGKLFMANMAITDVDELSAQMTGWENDWRQLDAGKALNQIAMVAGQHTVFQQVRLSHSVHQQGKTPDQLMTFGFPDKPSKMMWNSVAVPCPAVFDFNGADGYDAVSGADFRGVTISLPKDYFLRVAESLNIPASHQSGGMQPFHLTDEYNALTKFRHYLYWLLTNLSDAATQGDHHLVSAELDKELPARLLMALDGSRSDSRIQTLKARQRGLRLAIEFVEECCHDNPSIPDICIASGLSWRSLDRAFRECFGIGPKRYMLNLRLIHVRRSLKNEPPGAKIADIANNWSFWHMGDFAREYRKMFCELPSETHMQRWS